jgi:hypothetical protein
MAILVATLIDQGQLLADKRNDASLAPADWLTFVNWSVVALWRLLCSLDPDAYFTQAPDFALAGGIAGSSRDLAGLTPDFRALHGIDLSPDTTSRRTVPRRNFRERNRGHMAWWAPAALASDRAYDLRGRTLYFTPYELAAGTYRVYYRGGPYQFTAVNDATALDWQLEPYAEFVSQMTARFGLNIEESDPSPINARLAELTEEITSEHARDDESPGRIADVEDDD